MSTQTFKIALMRHTPSGSVSVYKESDVRMMVGTHGFDLASEFVEVSFPLIEISADERLAQLDRQQQNADECARIEDQVAKIRKGAV
jgi:hypothetical protein